MLTIKQFTCNILQENCYIISDETKECIICDCGAYSQQECLDISEYISSHQLIPTHLVATHGHIDHNLGNNTIYNLYGLLPEVHKNDQKLMDILDKQAEMLLHITIDYPMPPIKYFGSNYVLKFGNHKFSVIETPGHSQGSVFFYCQEEGIALSGDTLFRHAIGRTDFIGGSMFQIIHSLRQISQLPDTTKIYPGHGEMTTIGNELASNRYLDR